MKLPAAPLRPLRFRINGCRKRNMRIIDGNKDYYDFWQNIWRDNTVTFDRRNSYDLSKEEFAGAFTDESYKWSDYILRMRPNRDRHKFVLLQVCNTFWLFDLLITKTGEEGICLDYELNLRETWLDYTCQPELIHRSHIRPNYYWRFFQNEKEFPVDSIKRGEYKTVKVFNNFANIKPKGDGQTEDLRSIPILKNIGIAAEVSADKIFLALEEYFLTQKKNSERTESIGLTDLEKITNHGFDIKTSFRGK